MHPLQGAHPVFWLVWMVIGYYSMDAMTIWLDGSEKLSSTLLTMIWAHKRWQTCKVTWIWIISLHSYGRSCGTILVKLAETVVIVIICASYVDINFFEIYKVRRESFVAYLIVLTLLQSVKFCESCVAKFKFSIQRGNKSGSSG